VDYDKKSKEELIEEVKILKKENEHISLVLDNINEMFYIISFDVKGNRKITFLSNQVIFG